MRRLLTVITLVTAVAAAGASLEDGWSSPPDDSRPWCYWWWVNGHADERTITGDLEAMRRLGFAGLLMFDSRGYWDDERHVVNPKAEIAFMSDEWQRLVVHAVKEAARLGLKFTMNMSSSGGKLDGPWEVGADAPKRLVYKLYPAGTDRGAMERPADLKYYHDIAVQTVWYTGEELVVPSEWMNGGDGVYTMASSSGRRVDSASAQRRRLAVPGTPGARRILVRFGYAVLPEHEHDVDVLDAKAVAGHFERFQGTLMAKLPGLVGRDKTLTHLYSVSWEGTMPTWTGDFDDAFRRYAGFDIIPHLPQLAGFDAPDAADNEKFMRAYRRVRNDLFRDRFYGTMRDLAHARNVDWYSESGGPWRRGPQLFREADQISFLAVNDLPQGEFWPAIGADLPGRHHVRAAVSTAHLYGYPRASAEAFTHMMRHWSVDPAYLKRSGDTAFVGGINHLVWHTFTCSPDKFGVPGAEYFAGSHINRHVTWHAELSAFVGYLARCQWMLQRGRPVMDYALYAGDRPYQHWGLYDEKPYDASKARLPRGYSYDLVDDGALLKRLRVEGGRLVLPDSISYDALVWDPEFPDEPLSPAVLARVEEFKKAGLKVFGAAEAARVAEFAPPDFEGPFRAIHRRDADADIYFVQGDGKGTMTFRESSAGRRVEIWDAVTGNRFAAAATARADGRTDVAFDLPFSGSAFVVFRKGAAEDLRELPAPRAVVKTVAGPWRVSFSYPAGISAPPPAPAVFDRLVDWTTRGDLKHFAGSGTYCATVNLTAAEAARAAEVSIGRLPSGLASVKVNGTDCGVVWCAPWKAEAAGRFREGENSLEVKVVNNWHNRLIGDCFLPPEKRVTKSTLRYWDRPRTNAVPGNAWTLWPTVFSGYAISDPLQPSGLLGPVEIR
jgi:hypothetical protein